MTLPPMPSSMLLGFLSLFALFTPTHALREGMHSDTIFPFPSPSGNRTIVWINGGPVASVSHILDSDLQRLANEVRMPIRYFDFCGVGKSTCPLATTYAGLEGQIREFVTEVAQEIDPRSMILTLFSAAALSAPNDVLSIPGTLVYLSPVTDLQSSLAVRQTCMRSLLQGAEPFVPTLFGENLSIFVCGLYCPNRQSFLPACILSSLWARGNVATVRDALLQSLGRELVREGYDNDVAFLPPDRAGQCVAVAYGEYDRVVDKATVVAFHDRLTLHARHRTVPSLVVVPDAAHFPMFDNVPALKRVFADACP